MESSKEQHLFEIEIFCSIINVFTVTFHQFNASLMTKYTFLNKIILKCPYYAIFKVANIVL